MALPDPGLGDSASTTSRRLGTRRARRHRRSAFLVVAALAVGTVTLGAGDESRPDDEVIELDALKIVAFSEQIDCAVVTRDKVVKPTSPVAAVLITAVKPKSPAAAAGLEPGMRILWIRPSSQSPKIAFTGPKLTIEHAKHQLRSFAESLSVTDAERERGWVEMELGLNDLRDTADRRGLFTATIRVKIHPRTQRPRRGLAHAVRRSPESSRENPRLTAPGTDGYRNSFSKPRSRSHGLRQRHPQR